MATMFGKEKRQKAPEQVGKFRGAVGPAALKPKVGLTLTDPNPTVATVLSFERAAIKDTIFTFTASEAAIVNVKNGSFKGFTAKALRKDGAAPWTSACHAAPVPSRRNSGRAHALSVLLSPNRAPVRCMAGSCGMVRW